MRENKLFIAKNLQRKFLFNEKVEPNINRFTPMSTIKSRLRIKRVGDYWKW